MLFFYVFDLAADRTTSMVYRYHFILSLAGILIIAWYLDRMQKIKYRIAPIILICVLGVSVLSTVRISQDPCYNNIGFCKPYLAAAEVLSAESKPLIITDAFYAFLLYFWEITIACNSEDIDVLYRPDSDKLHEYLHSEDYSNVYLTELNSSATFGLIKVYQQDSNSVLPIPIDIDTYAAALVEDRNADRDAHRLDLSVDLHTYNVTIDVKTPELAAVDTVFITGNHYTVGDYDPRKVPMHYRGEGQWQISLQVESGFDFEYRFTLGNWDRMMADSTEYTYDNYELNVAADTSVLYVIPGRQDN